MAQEITEITDRIVSVTRRRFVSGAAGTVAIAGAALLPIQAGSSAEPLSTEEIANALHEAVGRYSERKTPVSFDKPLTEDTRSCSVAFAMECLRDCTVEEIQALLKPFVGGAA